MAAPAKKPVLVQLDMDFSEGGSSPWFNSKGRSTVASLTSAPENADLFTELARDGSMGALVSYLDTEQSSVSHVTLVCYILTGLVLVELFVGLPIASLALRRYTAAVGMVLWLVFELILLCCAAVQLICLLAMISTWYGMQDGLATKAPEAYDWTFELLRNYTKATVLQLKDAKDPDPNLDKALSTTTNSIKWMQGNLSAWEDSFAGYAGLKDMVTGPLPLLQMGLLGLALAVAVGSALLACTSWSRRTRNLEKGGKSPVFVAVVVIAGAVLLFLHLAVAFPTIARWLPVCVLADTYVCAPYRDGEYSIIDDGVARLWSPANRPEPFCRLIPSALFGKCSIKDKAGIKDLQECSSKSSQANVTTPVLNTPQAFLLQLLASSTSAPSNTKIIGDCFYPYKIIYTDMTSACPLFADELLGHWMALVLCALFGMLSALAAAAIGIIFLAIGEKKKKKIIKKRKIVRKKRVKKEKEKPLPPPPPPPTPPPPPPPPPEPVNIEVEVPVPVPVPVRRRRRHRCPRPTPPVIVMPPPRCHHSPPPPPPPPQPLPMIMPPPMLFAPPMMAPMMPPMTMPAPAVPPIAPAPAPPPDAPKIMPSCSGENQQAALAYTNVNVYGASGGSAWPYSPAMGMALPTAQLGGSATIPMLGGAAAPPPPDAPRIMTSCSGENQQAALAYTNVNVYGASGGVGVPYATTMGMALPGTLPGYQAMLSPQMGFPTVVSPRQASAVRLSPQRGYSVAQSAPMRSASVHSVAKSSPVVQRTRSFTATPAAVAPSPRAAQAARSAAQPVVTKETTYVTHSKR